MKIKLKCAPDPTDLLSLTGDVIACDTETTGLFPFLGDRPYAFSFCNEKGDTRFLRVDVNPMTRGVRLDVQTQRQLRDFFSDRHRQFVFFNAKFDVRMLEHSGVPIDGKIQEAMFAMHALNSGEPSMKLKPLAKKYADFPDDDEKELKRAVMSARRKAKQLGWKIAEKIEPDYWLAPPEMLKRYTVGDAERTMLLWLLACEQMPAMNVQRVYDDEMTLWPTVYAMEDRGCRIDLAENQRRIIEYTRNGETFKQTIYKLAGTKFNIDSDDELRWVLYKKLKLPVLGYTEKKNEPSVDAPTMAKLRDEHNAPIANAVMGYRGSTKAIVTWFDTYRKHAVLDQTTGEHIVHSDFRQIGPRTGRFACANPNLQNAADPYSTRSLNPIPVQARAPFGPRRGYDWYSIDYSQIENRIFADIAKEQTMLDAFKHGEDIHAFVANMCWPEEYAHELKAGGKNVRSRAKTIDFGIIFGIGIATAAIRIGCTKSEAKAFIGKYMEKFPNIRKSMDRMISIARRDGVIHTLYGRRIPVDTDFAYRAVNYSVQGTAADVMKRGMRQCAAMFKQTNADIRLVMTIHDELVFEVKKEHAYKWLIQRTQRAMEDHGGVLSLPLPTDVSRHTARWDLKEKIKWN